MTNESPVRRRTVLTAAAWSTPIIAASVATPAIASSTSQDYYTVTSSVDDDYSIIHCKATEPGWMYASVTKNGGGFTTGAGIEVTFILNGDSGLRFVGTNSRYAFVTANSFGFAACPPVQAVGSVGTYSIMAAVTVGAGATVSTKVKIERDPNAQSTAMMLGLGGATTPADPSFTDELIVSSAVAQNVWTMISKSGGLWYAGTAFGLAASARPVRATGLSNPVTKVAAATTKTETYLLVADSANKIWYSSQSKGAPVFTDITGSVTGQVLDIATYYGANIVRTTKGIWVNGRALDSASSEKAPFAFMIPGSSGTTVFSSWGRSDESSFTNSDAYFGVGYVDSAGAIKIYSGDKGTQSSKNVPAVPLSAAVQLGGGRGNYLYARTKNNAVYAFGGSNTSWRFVVQDVQAMSTWSISTNGGTQTGGIALGIKGTIVQFQSNYVKFYQGVDVSNSRALNAVQLYSSDGAYYALSAKGELYGWNGNLDGTPTQPAKIASATNATDLVMTSVHTAEGNNFATYGVISSAVACTLL